jgi:hypothetical protein
MATSGSTQQRIESIQKNLGLRPDGVLGPVSLTTLENSLGLATPAQHFSLSVSKKSLDALVGFEISSEANYNRSLKNPIWPGAESGVTIGIGYDLGFNTAATILGDWAGQVSESDLQRLASVAGLKGTVAKAALGRVKDIVVPFPAARKIFFEVTAPKFAKLTRATYTGTELLFADTQGVLLSLIYNRGSSLAITERRTEMRAIKPLVAASDYAGIAFQLREMKKRFTLPGLISRREKEALMVLGSDRLYTPEEIVRI